MSISLTLISGTVTLLVQLEKGQSKMFKNCYDLNEFLSTSGDRFTFFFLIFSLNEKFYAIGFV
ncbi:hypothetical protein ACI8B_280168 [Acinetobacter proteolyticus]|uniref:Uncharacterized protein n=1 Tax=Acinetobacter proteolyticus TaxID=1776741 RepID=A0A653K5U3_9GAMM|nr:hypothetical protein ACI8B_280168 [Acinetobacter proteolyticus]